MRGFRRTLLAAIASGLLAGLLLTGIQRWQVAPLLQQSDVIERQAQGAAAKPKKSAGQKVIVLDGQAPTRSNTQPTVPDRRNGQRLVAAVIANAGIGIGLGLLLAIALVMHGSGGALAGLAWGVAGYLVFFLVPAFGIPAKLTGSAVTPLLHGEAWWWLAASCTAVALALMLLQRSWLARLAGLVILFVPFITGTPRTRAAGESAEAAEIFSDIFWATAVCNLAFWLVLAVVCGFILGRRKSQDDFLL